MVLAGVTRIEDYKEKKGGCPIKVISRKTKFYSLTLPYIAMFLVFLKPLSLCEYLRFWIGTALAVSFYCLVLVGNAN